MELQVIRNGDVVHAVSVTESRLYIGRAPENELVIGDSTVSSSHACVWVENDQIWLRDLGSRNGSFVNDERIQGATPITNTDRIRLGPSLELKVHGSAVPAFVALAFLVEDTKSNVRTAVRSDRFHMGGGTAHLVLSGAPELAATLIIYPDGEVYLGTDDVEERQLQLGDVFEVAGHSLRLLAAPPSYDKTIEAEPSRYPYHLRCTLDGVSGPEAQVTDGQLTHRIDAENRAILLYVLGKKWLEDKKAGKDRMERGWCSDADVSVGIWGRKGTSDANALHVLTHRLRKELKKAGFDPWFIEKRRRALRIRVREVEFK
ncbi:MAG: hypothetical protein ACI9MC_001390 [Kiritimatiellia bacterium]|jgi:hypothetical protein